LTGGSHDGSERARTYTVVVLCIGNELLIGKTLNTNAHWLAKNITRLGGAVRRIVSVGDDVDEIAAALKTTLSTRPSLIITTGGLGPTFDDKTLKGVAQALKVPLRLNEDAARMVAARYLKYGRDTGQQIPLTPARMKMAILPEGAIPLENPVGTAPGVLLTSGHTDLIALPGVPREMKGLFETTIVPRVRNVVGLRCFCERQLSVSGIIESELAPLLDTVMAASTAVYIKSHPQAAEPTPHIELHLTTTARRKTAGATRLEEATELITTLITSNGGVVTPLAP
jgi:molybdenum cofactor synthesis domain-containing protein